MFRSMPRAQVLIAYKGYDSNKFRQALKRRGIEACIPPRRHRKVLIPYDKRHRAMGIIAAVKAGEDPAAKRDADREAITVKELSERFDREHISVRLKSNTAAGYRRLMERNILPAIGKQRVIDVSRADIS